MAVDVDALFAACTTGGRRPDALTASHVYVYAASRFAWWCEHHAPPAERDPVTGFYDLLFEKGREHEERTFAARHPERAPLRFETEEEGFRLALDAMAAGAPAILGAPLLHHPAGLRGRADILVRNDDAPSVFGSYHYEVEEIKLAKNLRSRHRLQGAFYNHLLGLIQQRAPRTFRLVNGEGAVVPFDHDEAELARAFADMRAIRAGERVAPEYGGGIWPWSAYADKLAIASDDVSLVDGVGPALRGSLLAAGIATVRALAEAREDALLGVKGVGETRGRRLPVLARALVTKAHVRLDDVALAEDPLEIFLDLEGTGTLVEAEGIEPIDYLIGALVRHDGVETYVPFVASTLDDEGPMMRAFVEWLEAQPPCVVYHWHHYERTHLRKVAAKHGLAERWRALEPRLRDLHKDATRAFAFPTYGTGLKQVAPYVGFRWRHKDVNAMESIALYLDHARDPERNPDALRKVLDYNEDDCRATLAVKDWLAAQAKGRPGGAARIPLA